MTDAMVTNNSGAWLYPCADQHCRRYLNAGLDGRLPRHLRSGTIGGDPCPGTGAVVADMLGEPLPRWGDDMAIMR